LASPGADVVVALMLGSGLARRFSPAASLQRLPLYGSCGLRAFSPGVTFTNPASDE
jgi:hypothetical protein